MRRLRILPIVFLIFFNCFSQITEYGVPLSYEIKNNARLKSTPSIHFFKLPEKDYQKLKEKSYKENGYKKMPAGYNHSIEIKFENTGEWIKTGENQFLKKIGIISNNAHGIALIFGEFRLTKHSSIFIYSPGYKDVIGKLTHNNNSKILPTRAINSDTVIIEINTKDKNNYGNVELDNVIHLYINNKSELKSGSCNIDINCLSGLEWQKEKRSVVKYFYTEGFSTYKCSGAIINNSNYDGEPYIITARHCIDRESEAQSMLAHFNYENKKCNIPWANESQTISGATLISSHPDLDISLVRLNDLIPVEYNPYFSGWNADELHIPSSTTCIHHPDGDVKKITKDYDSPLIASADLRGTDFEENTHYFIEMWEEGTTEPGSSGAPLYNQNHKIVGTLTGGSANCSDPSADYFQRISPMWYKGSPEEQLENWLDPLSSGIKTLEGFDPIVAEKDTISNADKSDTSNYYKLQAPEIGILTGKNSLSPLAYAERFISDSIITLHTIIAKTGKLESYNFFSEINFKVWNGDSVPVNELYSFPVRINTLVENNYNSIYLDKLVAVPDTFFVGYELSDNSADTFSVFAYKNNFDSLGKQNTAFVKTATSWESFYKTYGQSFSLDISVIPGYAKTNNITQQKEKQNLVSIYPNPANNFFHIKSKKYQNICYIELINIAGKTVFFEENINSEKFNVNTSNIPKGLYIAKIKTSVGLSVKKVIIK